ncbi:MAG TPA: hypothetical protein VIM85_03335 [Pseudomonadales bacterium]
MISSSFIQQHRLSSVAAVLLALAFAVYYCAFAVPFYFDDYSSIVHNEALLKGDFFQYIASRRAIPQLSLCLDYQLWADNFRFYHLQNIALHGFNAVLVFCLVSRLTTVTRGKPQLWFAFFVAVLWLVHPLNSQPVIYIVQRMALWATFFSLLSLLFFFKFRQSNPLKWQYLAACIVFAVCALVSKETAVVLPAVILLTDIVVFKPGWRRLAKAYLPIAGAVLLIVLALFALTNIDLVTLDAMTKEHGVMDRLSYFLAQQEIVANYLKKFFFPHPLLLEYPYYKAGSLSAAWPWLVLHLTIITASLAFIVKAPQLTYGVLFYYVFHLVESGVIPITDLAVEHRTYLPNIGLAIAVTTLLSYLVKGLNARAVLGVALLVITAAAVFTTIRVMQWQDKAAFYMRELRYNNENPRILSQLGAIYAKKGDLATAEHYFRQAFHLGWQQQRVSIYQIESLIEILVLRNNMAFLQRFYAELDASFKDDPKWRSDVNSILAKAFVKLKRCDIALPPLRLALELNPHNSDAKRLKAQCEQQ